MSLSIAELRDLSRLLDEALALAPADRAGWLGRLAGAEARLRVPLIQALQAADDDAASRLDGPPPLAGADGDGVAAGDRVGPWRLLEEIGRGGMGRVWRAERADGLYRREVALKLPRLSRGPALAERMAREREVAARLEHPHIARLYDAGVDAAGRPFLVMEQVSGLPIDRHADERGLDLDTRLRLLLQACDALAHAHRMLVVHRDLKPEHLPVDAEGRLRLLDFGVAGLLDEAPTASGGGHTPRWSAPEQRRGEPVGTATDLYQLALVAHLLLTGGSARFDPGGRPQPASEASIDDEAARRRGFAEARALRLALRRRGLDAVLARALADAPADRQPGIDALATDLRACLAHRVPPSWAAPATDRLRLFARRHRRALTLAVVALAALALGAQLLLQERARTRAEEVRVAKARDFMLGLLWQAEPAPGQSAAAITSGQLLDTAVARARDELGSEPLLQASVLNEIAVLARHLGRADQAGALLRQALSLAEADADGAATRHVAAAQLAMQRLEEGGPGAAAEAERLATSALDGCTARGTACERARAYAASALSGLRAAAGDMAGAIAQMRASVAAHVVAFGAEDANTVWQRLNLATLLRNAERWDEARVELDRTLDAAARLRLTGAGQARLLSMDALLHADAGRHGDALTTLDALLRWLGPERPERVRAERLRAQSAFALGRLDLALQAAEAAAGQPAGARVDRLLALQLRVRALAAQGRDAAAQQAWAEQAAEVTSLGMAPESVLGLRSRRLAGELALRRGDAARAIAELEPLTRPPLSDRPGSQADLAQALDLLGAARRAGGEPAAALELHRRAEAALDSLPAVHPLRLRNQLDQAWAAALTAASGPPYPPAALRQAADAVLAPLPADSAWRPLVQRLLAERDAGTLLLP